MKKKAREIQQRNKEMAKSGRTPGFNSGGGFGSGTYRSEVTPVIDAGSAADVPAKSSYSKPRYVSLL